MNTENTQQEARQAMIQQRQDEEHLQQSMLNRTAAEVNVPADGNIQAEARELMVENRQDEEHLHESMLNRASAEVGVDRHS